MLSAEQINEIHRLHWAEHWSVRNIARHLHIGRRTRESNRRWLALKLNMEIEERENQTRERE
jgi:hypothetical protein